MGGTSRFISPMSAETELRAARRLDEARDVHFRVHVECRPNRPSQAVCPTAAILNLAPVGTTKTRGLRDKTNDSLFRCSRLSKLSRNRADTPGFSRSKTEHSSSTPQRSTAATHVVSLDGTLWRQADTLYLPPDRSRVNSSGKSPTHLLPSLCPLMSLHRAFRTLAKNVLLFDMNILSTKLLYWARKFKFLEMKASNLNFRIPLGPDGISKVPIFSSKFYLMSGEC